MFHLSVPAEKMVRARIAAGPKVAISIVAKSMTLPGGKIEPRTIAAINPARVGKKYVSTPDPLHLGEGKAVAGSPPFRMDLLQLAGLPEDQREFLVGVPTLVVGV